jgi:hypothetical protein
VLARNNTDVDEILVEDDDDDDDIRDADVVVNAIATFDAAESDATTDKNLDMLNLILKYCSILCAFACLSYIYFL